MAITNSMGFDKFWELDRLIRKRMDFQDLWSDLHDSLPSMRTMTIHSSIGPHSESPKLSGITSFEPRFPTTLSHEPLGFVLTTNNFSESSRLKESDGVIGSS